MLETWRWRWATQPEIQKRADWLLWSCEDNLIEKFINQLIGINLLWAERPAQLGDAHHGVGHLGGDGDQAGEPLAKPDGFPADQRLLLDWLSLPEEGCDVLPLRPLTAGLTDLTGQAGFSTWNSPAQATCILLNKCLYWTHDYTGRGKDDDYVSDRKVLGKSFMWTIFSEKMMTKNINLQTVCSKGMA